MRWVNLGVRGVIKQTVRCKGGKNISFLALPEKPAKKTRGGERRRIF